MVEAAGSIEIERDGLRFPFPEPPTPDQPIEIAPGILWVRFPLPFRLDHVNLYLIEDGDGYAVIDTGISDDVTRAHWRALMAGPLAGKKLTRLIVTHFHPDHIGLAGWLCEEYGLPLLTSQTSYLMTINISLTPGALKAKPYQDFYLRHGMAPDTADLVSTQGHAYLSMVTQLPPTFLRLVAGDTLTIGSRQFRVYTGDGHAPEQIMLYLADEKILFAADQVIAKITPNISVWAVDPEGDPLGHFLRTVRLLEAHVPEDALVLPGHQLPFYGLHTRCQQIVGHHEDRCQMIAEACQSGPKTVADLVPVLFHRPLDPHQLSFAFSETHAHVNRMIRRGELTWIHTDGDVSRVVLA